MVVTLFVKYKEHRDDIQRRILQYYRSGDRSFYAGRKVAESASSRDSDTNTIHLINQLILEVAQSLSTKSMLFHRDRHRQIQRIETPQPPRKRGGHRPSSAASSPAPCSEAKVQLFMESVVAPMAECSAFLKSTVYELIAIAKHEKKGTKLALFVKDLENIWDLPSWPVAEYALLITFQLFRAVLASTSKSRKNEDSLKVLFS